MLPDTVNLTRRTAPVQWTRIDDLYTAGPEVPVPDLRLSPGAPQPPPAEAERLHRRPRVGRSSRFGDGLHGRRPPAGARIRADYAYGSGARGQRRRRRDRDRARAARRGQGHEPGSHLGRRRGGDRRRGREADRALPAAPRPLVTAEDFDTIVRRTPGVDDRPRRRDPGVQPGARAERARRRGRRGDADGDPAGRPAPPGRAAARPAVPRRDLRLHRPAPARDDRGLPARADVQADLGLRRLRSRRGPERRRGARRGEGDAAARSSRRSPPRPGEPADGRRGASRTRRPAGRG